MIIIDRRMFKFDEKLDKICCQLQIQRELTITGTDPLVRNADFCLRRILLMKYPQPYTYNISMTTAHRALVIKEM